MKNLMGKNDWLLAAGIALCAVCLLTAMILLRKPGKEIEIQIDGETFGVYSLTEPQIIDYGTGNRLEIRDGEVKMIWADCPDKLCVHEAAISRTGQTIVCLPHRLVVRVIRGEEAEYDSVSG